MTRKLGDFNAHNLFNTLWFYAKMGRSPTLELQARLELEASWVSFFFFEHFFINKNKKKLKFF